MILRVLIMVMALGGSFTSTIFAGSERGSRIVSESGGIAGVQGIAGVAGVVGSQGIPGIQGLPGSIVAFSDFYALQGGAFDDNPGMVMSGAPVNFPRLGSNNGVITAVNSSTFLLPAVATYLVLFQVSVTQAGQLGLSLNGSVLPIANSVVGRDALVNQIVGISLVTTTSPASTLRVINPGAIGITVTPNAGGVQPVSAHIVILQL